MAMNLTRGLDPEAVWRVLYDTITEPFSIGQLVKDKCARSLNFFDDFNRAGVDADIWTSGGPAGGFAHAQTVLLGTLWQMYTGAVAGQDRYIHGDGVIYNKYFSPHDEDIFTVTWECRMHLVSVANIAVFLGLLEAPIVNYAEPLSRVAHFFIDTAISGNIFARSYRAAEEETDTGIAADLAPHDYRIVWEAADINFYIDDVLVATHAAQVPEGAMTTEILLRTLANVTKYLRLHYIHVEVNA